MFRIDDAYVESLILDGDDGVRLIVMNDEHRAVASRKARAPQRVREVFASVADNVHYARHLIRGHKIRSQMNPSHPDQPPVALVHGFLGTRATMEPLTRRFQNDGRTVFSYAYGNFNTAAIQESAQGLLRQLRTLSEDYGSERIDLVGYSMGGLLGLYALKTLGAARYVRSLAMLGTPLRGSWLSVAGVAALGAVSSSVWQLLPRAKILDELRARPIQGNVRLAQFHARNDLFCPDPGKLADVRDEDYQRASGGHSSLIVAPHFYQLLRDFHERVEADAEIRRNTTDRAAPEPNFHSWIDRATQ